MKSIVFFLATTVASAGSLAVGPDYERPSTTTPSAYRNLPVDGGWIGNVIAPGALFHGAWWEIYGDATLNDLEARALAANQDLRAAVARVEEARAAAGYARGAYFPSVALEAAAMREHTSATTHNVLPRAEATTYLGSLGAAWEIDLFGRVRRLNESARADAAASAALFDAVRLSLSADVAANYFAIVGASRELALVREGVALRNRALDMVKARVRSGASADLDLARAEAELATAEVEAAGLENHVEGLRNALAILAGQSAIGFSFVFPTALPAVPAPVPPGLPSDLLQRRPDIAAAERALAASNARIGVAQAAFFPSISLTGAGGYASGEIDRLTDVDSRIWSIGPRLYLPLFQGGRNRATLERSRASHEEATAVYRQRVLVAFREVQDALAGARWLDEEAAAQDRVIMAARRALGLAQKRYEAGYVAYLEVIDAQRTALAGERAGIQFAARRLTNRVELIKALGGGWQAPGASIVARN